MKIAALFPGQGSQNVGMGRDLVQTNDTARGLFADADSVLGFSLSDICFNGPLESLTLTENAQPAILTASCAAFLASEMTDFAAAAGHSLGEYSALVAAKALTFEDAVLLVHKRGRYMQEAVKPGEGKMAAVMGPSEEEIQKVINQSASGKVEIANLNSPGQTVVAGEAKAIDAFSSAMREYGGKLIPLNVSAPFHCSLMRPAADKLAADLDAITFSDPIFPVYVNVTAKAVNTGDEARELLKQQVCASVRWTDSMIAMIEDCGIDATIEFGAGGVLSKLLKRINSTPARHDVYDSDSLEKLKQSFC